MYFRDGDKWRWDDGPLCETKEEALKTASKQKQVSDGEPEPFFMDGSMDGEFIDD